MSFNWVPTTVSPVVSPTDRVAEAKRIGGPKGYRNDSELGNAQALLVRKEL
jgi:hypothetical protein